MGKVYVEVILRQDIQGALTPLSICWEDGHVYEIDRVLDVSERASLKAGGQGRRFTCRIGGRERYLFLDTMENRWFVEAKEGR